MSESQTMVESLHFKRQEGVLYSKFYNHCLSKRSGLLLGGSCAFERQRGSIFMCMGPAGGSPQPLAHSGDIRYVASLRPPSSCFCNFLRPVTCSRHKTAPSRESSYRGLDKSATFVGRLLVLAEWGDRQQRLSRDVHVLPGQRCASSGQWMEAIPYSICGLTCSCLSQL